MRFVPFPERWGSRGWEDHRAGWRQHAAALPKDAGCGPWSRDRETDQQLNAAQVSAGVEQVCGKGVAQHMRTERLPNPSCACSSDSHLSCHSDRRATWDPHAWPDRRGMRVATAAIRNRNVSAACVPFCIVDGIRQRRRVRAEGGIVDRRTFNKLAGLAAIGAWQDSPAAASDDNPVVLENDDLAVAFDPASVPSRRSPENRPAGPSCAGLSWGSPSVCWCPCRIAGTTKCWVRSSSLPRSGKALPSADAALGKPAHRTRRTVVHQPDRRG